MTDDDKALVERLRYDCELALQLGGDACVVLPAADVRTIADRIEALSAENERLREALERIADGTMPRPLGEPWRMDMTSSKHDRCVHGAWMYEPCEGCIDAFISSVLGGDNG